MSRTEMKPTWYAMYRGDTFIDLGTADYLAEKYHKKKQSLQMILLKHWIEVNAG